MADLAYDETKTNPQYEIINGEVVMQARPAMYHIKIAGRLYNMFFNFLKGKRCEAFMEPDLFLNENQNFIPDVVVVCNPDIIRQDGIYGAPDLVVEVLSPGTGKRDRKDKKDAYEAAGVREYWIVNPADKSIEAYHLVDRKLILDEVYQIYPDWQWAKMSEEDRAKAMLAVKVSLYDDLVVDIREIFEP